MIPAPKLDDRTYADIVAEAMRLIPRYCPEWTNHNPSDPGVTVLELTAWMTELILYRLNRVPEKNYLAFLDLIGVRLRSPQPAHTLLTFDLVEGGERQTIREGTQVATPQAADEDTVVFETERELRVNQQIEVERGEVVFFGPGDMQPTTVHGLENTWVRGRLAEVPRNPTETEVDTIRAVIETIGEGQPPEHALANLAGTVFIAL